VVDGYLRAAQEVGTDAEELESAVFQQDARQTNANRIDLLKREVLEVRRAVNPLLADAHAFVGDTCTWVPPPLHRTSATSASTCCGPMTPPSRWTPC
jgi:magnesium transporter